jgi:DNA-binding NtrC family response regulator
VNQQNVRKIILIVDDEKDLREVLRKTLELKGYEILEAQSGRRGFEIIQNQHVDLVITDIRMADGDGIELLKRIRVRDPKFPPVIMMSGFSGVTTAEAIALGASNYFVKPFSFREIQMSIADLLRGVP